MIVAAESPLRYNRLFTLVRDFAVTTREWQPAIRYRTRQDEAYDLTLASLRVYGTRAEFLVIQAAAGLDSPEQAMTERDLVLPTRQQLDEMKRRAGYVRVSGLY